MLLIRLLNVLKAYVQFIVLNNPSLHISYFEDSRIPLYALNSAGYWHAGCAKFNMTTAEKNNKSASIDERSNKHADKKICLMRASKIKDYSVRTRYLANSKRKVSSYPIE